MSNKAVINTSKAPAAIGPYSQAIKAGNTVYLSGQIPLDPATMAIVSEDFEAQARQVFTNLQAVCEEAAGSLSDIVKLNLYLVDLDNFAIVNQVMEEFFTAPFPARAAVGVKALPKGSQVEAEAVMVIGD
ncbi:MULTISPECIES: RidA family protein [Halomonadaceae]|jgi:reactive intermediate/imine deaminase|uniref:RidA family protein n=6 Tax=Halomonadaceae TaxID=28256 RepID=A0A7Z0SNT4_9GAMM|nr:MULTISPECIES: RidA family protein [Halomonas]NAO98190.1 RidA family protein [Halomonas sp. MG34]QGQ71090.1 RidA family protein [Halomonas sp. PA16-9]UEQ04213.1 RidA family protein [Halomonas profundus]BBI54804.1 reactive intermediate/imine deaminase [Halomonas olivaria]KIN17055.1 endoribonuclease [Halomonas sp. KHS3]|tara:strand:+ start:121273 stop:121662 length:390 start_codon:yes stop_codon:yes gene_type:complete